MDDDICLWCSRWAKIWIPNKNPEPQCLIPEIMTQLGIFVGHVLLPELDNFEQSRWNNSTTRNRKTVLLLLLSFGGVICLLNWVYRLFVSLLALLLLIVTAAPCCHCALCTLCMRACITRTRTNNQPHWDILFYVILLFHMHLYSAISSAWADLGAYQNWTHDTVSLQQEHPGRHSHYQ